jgi:predicted ribosomally synthesized peptide with nif11-like leader
MSIELAKKFMDQLGGDDRLREGLLSKGGTKEQRIDAFVATGQESGFVFSRQDVVSILASASNEQLHDRELEQVVGGMTTLRYFLGSVYSWLGGGGGGDSGGGGTVGVRG